MICPRFIVVEICFKIVGEEKHFQHNKHDKKLDYNYKPQGFSNGHVAKTFTVECEKLLKKGREFHVIWLKVNQQLLCLQKYE